MTNCDHSHEENDGGSFCENLVFTKTNAEGIWKKTSRACMATSMQDMQRIVWKQNKACRQSSLHEAFASFVS